MAVTSDLFTGIEAAIFRKNRYSIAVKQLPRFFPRLAPPKSGYR